MKKGLLIVAAVILLVAVLLGIIFWPSSKKPKTDNAEDTVDLLATDSADFFEKLDQSSTEYIKIDEDYYVVPGQTVLGAKTDVYVTLDNGKIGEITVHYPLFSNTEYSGDFGTVTDDAETGDGEGEIVEGDSDTDVKEYKYSSDERKEIQSAVDNLKKSFEDRLNCAELTDYSMTPFVETEGQDLPKDDFDKVLQGYYQMEYSVRDEQGRLWFLWVYSPYSGMVEASVAVVNSQDRYQGFQPIINLQQQSNIQMEGE